MNLLKSPLRRTTAALAGAFIGLAGAVAFAAPASAHYTELTGRTDCLDNGGWKVDWTLTPKNALIDGKIVKVEETPDGSSGLKNIVKRALVPVGGTITDSQTFGKDVAEVTLSVTVVWVNEKTADAEAIAANLPTKTGDWKPGDDKIIHEAKATVKAPEDCKQPPSHPPATGTPKQILQVTCDTMTIGVDNPADGQKVTLHLNTSKGEERTLVIKPGEKKTTTFSATPGFVINVTAEGLEGGNGPVSYEQPKDCETGGSAGGETGGGGLPETGAAAGSIAGGAAVLLITGGTLFFLARRRKVKFTA